MTEKELETLILQLLRSGHTVAGGFRLYERAWLRDDTHKVDPQIRAVLRLTFHAGAQFLLDVLSVAAEARLSDDERQRMLDAINAELVACKKVFVETINAGGIQ